MASQAAPGGGVLVLNQAYTDGGVAGQYGDLRGDQDTHAEAPVNHAAVSFYADTLTTAAADEGGYEVPREEAMGVGTYERMEMGAPTGTRKLQPPALHPFPRPPRAGLATARLCTPRARWVCAAGRSRAAAAAANAAMPGGTPVPIISRARFGRAQAASRRQSCTPTPAGCCSCYHLPAWPSRGHGPHAGEVLEHGAGDRGGRGGHEARRPQAHEPDGEL